MSNHRGLTYSNPVRIDLHCHGIASSEADEALLNVIQCPESYSEPEEVYAQAKNRGMNFVTISDHDSIAGVEKILHHGDVIVGEELTCYFPEDHCKMHVLVWGINSAQHDALQSMADDIYQVAAYIEAQRIAHAVAHPLYRQNDRLVRWHLERLILMFKGFECLNGAHSMLHREAFEPLLDELTPERMDEFSRKHGIAPRWPEPWIKTRTAGSDDHGLFNIGRTFTEFPDDAVTGEDLLECLRTARCRPGGEAGSSLKLAHNFYSVGARYFTRNIACETQSPTLQGRMLQAMIGERPMPRLLEMVGLVVRQKVRGIGRRIRNAGRTSAAGGMALLKSVFQRSIRSRLPKHRHLLEHMKSGVAPLGEHEAMFSLVSDLNRDVAAGISTSITDALANNQIGPIFDSLSSIAGHQAMLLPYYFALFHQNRERQVLTPITGHGRKIDRESLRIGAFADNYGKNTNASRFARDVLKHGVADGRRMKLHTSTNAAATQAGRENFMPLFSRPLPFAADLELSLPPLTDVMEFADRQQFDSVHIDTFGPMGLCGLLVARMLRVPALATCHGDLATTVYSSAGGDYRLTAAARACEKWFYDQCDRVFFRSRVSHGRLIDLGIAREKLAFIPPAADVEKFNPGNHREGIWRDLGITQRYRIVHSGRLSADRNLSLLADTFARLCRLRDDAALVFLGTGPCESMLREKLKGLPVYFIDANEESLPALYASCDLLVDPSRSEVADQAIIDTQSSGVSVLVADQGGAPEVMDDGITGMILPATKHSAWAGVIDELLRDEGRRLRMSRTAPHRVARFGSTKMTEIFWDTHVQAALVKQAKAAAALGDGPTKHKPRDKFTAMEVNA